MSIPNESKPTSAPESTSDVILLAWLNATRILAIGSILPWVGMAFCSLISYPSKEWDLARVFFVITFYGYLFIILGIVYFARFAYKKNWVWAAWLTSIVSILPLFWFIANFFLAG